MLRSTLTNGESGRTFVDWRRVSWTLSTAGSSSCVDVRYIAQILEQIRLNGDIARRTLFHCLSSIHTRLSTDAVVVAIFRISVYCGSGGALLRVPMTCGDVSERDKKNNTRKAYGGCRSTSSPSILGPSDG